MRNLDLIKREIETKVKDYLERNGSEDETLSEMVEFDVTVGGIDYVAMVQVNGYFSLEPYYENDKFGIDVYIGDECTLESFDFEIEELVDVDAEKYIIEDYKTIESE